MHARWFSWLRSLVGYYVQFVTLHFYVGYFCVYASYRVVPSWLILVSSRSLLIPVVTTRLLVILLVHTYVLRLLRSRFHATALLFITFTVRSLPRTPHVRSPYAHAFRLVPCVFTGSVHHARCVRYVLYALRTRSLRSPRTFVRFTRLRLLPRFGYFTLITVRLVHFYCTFGYSTFVLTFAHAVYVRFVGYRLRCWLLIGSFGCLLLRWFVGWLI